MALMRWLLSVILVFNVLQLGAQEVSYGIQKTNLKTTIKQDSSIHIELVYDLVLDDSTVLSLKYLNFNTSHLGDVSASINGNYITMDFFSRNKLDSAKVDLTGVIRSNFKLTINYQISIKWSDGFDLIIPIIYPDINAANTNQDFFESDIRVYHPYSIFEAFPSASWESRYESIFTDHSLTLQAVPSMIKLKLGKGDRPFFSTLRLVDGAVILVLLVLLVLGWKKIREV